MLIWCKHFTRSLHGRRNEHPHTTSPSRACKCGVVGVLIPGASTLQRPGPPWASVRQGSYMLYSTACMLSTQSQLRKQQLLAAVVWNIVTKTPCECGSVQHIGNRVITSIHVKLSLDLAVALYTIHGRQLWQDTPGKQLRPGSWHAHIWYILFSGTLDNM